MQAVSQHQAGCAALRLGSTRHAASLQARRALWRCRSSSQRRVCDEWWELSPHDTTVDVCAVRRRNCQRLHSTSILLRSRDTGLFDNVPKPKAATDAARFVRF